MKFKIALIFFAVNLLLLNVSAQDKLSNKIDSLKKELTKKNINKEAVFLKLGEEFAVENKLDSSIYYYQKYQPFIINNNKKLSNYYNDLGIVYMRKGDVVKGKSLFNEGISIAKGRKLGNSYINLAIAYMMTNFPDSAYMNYYKAEQVYKSDSDSVRLKDNLMLKASILQKLGVSEKALSIFLEAQEYAIYKRDTLALAKVYQNIGMLYAENKEMTLAEEYSIKARDMYIKLGNQEGVNGISQNLANIVLEKQPKKAKSILFPIVKSYLDNNQTGRQLALIYHNLGRAYLKQYNLDSAKIYFQKAKQINEETQNLFSILKNNSGLATVFSKENKLDSADILLRVN